MVVMTEEVQQEEAGAITLDEDEEIQEEEVAVSTMVNNGVSDFYIYLNHNEFNHVFGAMLNGDNSGVSDFFTYRNNSEFNNDFGATSYEGGKSRRP